MRIHGERMALGHKVQQRSLHAQALCARDGARAYDELLNVVTFESLNRRSAQHPEQHEYRAHRASVYRVPQRARQRIHTLRL